MGISFLSTALDTHLGDLISAYRCEDAATPLTDSTANGFDLAEAATPVYSEVGKNNDCIKLVKASSEYFVGGDQAEYDLGTDDFCIAMWYKVDNGFAGAEVRRLMSRGDVETNNGDWCWGLKEDGGDLKFNYAFRSGGGITDIYGDTMTVNPGTWYHGALVLDGTTIRFYQDAVTKGTGTCAATLDSASSIYVGARLGPGPATKEYWDGWLDEIYWFNDQLSAADITLLQTKFLESVAAVPLRVRRDMKANVAVPLRVRRDMDRDQIAVPLRVRRDMKANVAVPLRVRRDAKAYTASKLTVRRDNKAYAASLLTVRHDHKGVLISKFRVRRQILSRKGWLIYVDGAYEGWINHDDSPLELTGISLANGDHEIEARPCGDFWYECRYPKFLNVTITAGELAADAPPPVANLRLRDLRPSWGRDILFTWHDDYGVETPADFAVWFADASPVSTAGAPDATGNALVAQRTHIHRYAQSAAKYAAVAFRNAGGTKGDSSEIYLDYPSAVGSPESQWAEDNV